MKLFPKRILTAPQSGFGIAGDLRITSTVETGKMVERALPGSIEEIEKYGNKWEVDPEVSAEPI